MPYLKVNTIIKTIQVADKIYDDEMKSGEWIFIEKKDHTHKLLKDFKSKITKLTFSSHLKGNDIEKYYKIYNTLLNKSIKEIKENITNISIEDHVKNYVNNEINISKDENLLYSEWKMILQYWLHDEIENNLILDVLEKEKVKEKEHMILMNNSNILLYNKFWEYWNLGIKQ